MLNNISYLADSSSGSGLGAFEVNIKSLVFQLITFVAVMLVFKRWILPPINKTLEDRRLTVEKGLADAKASQEALDKAQAKAEEILARARSQADEALAEARDAGAGVISKAEEAAAKRAEIIVKEAESRLSQEREKLRQELRAELGGLVAAATEKVISEKLDAKKDMSLIERAIRGISG